MKPKIFFLSETRTIENITDNELKIENYYLLRCDSKNRHTGGVAVYLHHSVQAYVIKKESENYVWSLSIKIMKGFLTDTFTVIYKGHSAKEEDFLNKIERICEDNEN